jgi:PKD repeat protein
MNPTRSAAVLLLLFATAPAASTATSRGPEVLPCVALSMIANPPDGGTLSAITPRDCRDGYRIGTTVALTAAPAAGFSFASWISDAGEVRNVAAPQTTLVVSGAGAVAVNFARQARAPDAHFAVSPAAPRVGEPIRLTDTSSGFPTSWSWDVGDDGHLDAAERSPVVLFDAPGAHEVRLIVNNRGGSSSTVQTVVVAEAPAGLDAVDPNPDLIDPDGSITQDPSRVAADSSSVVGAAADGATRLVVRYAAPGEGQVAFALATGSSPANDGGFLASESTEPASSITAPVSAVNGSFLAFAVYLVPPDFNLPSGHDTDHDRPLGLAATFTPTGGSASPPVALALRLYRPPIVLLHGLWSNSSVWTMPLIGLPYLDVPTPFADYRDTNADRLSVNLLVPYTAVNDVLAWDRARRIAATRADFIAHSMGGILARQWVASAGYAGPSNFNAGDFHKLITLDSPHLGARSATYIVGIREETIVGRLFSAAMYAAGMPINDGAVDDLEFFSPAIDALGLAEVGSHALAGVGGSEYHGFCSGLTGDFVRIVAFFARETVPELLTTIFDTEPNDVVVGLDSENGFLPSEATSTPIPGPDGAHFCVTSSGVYTDAIVTLLNTPVASDAFHFFPPVITAHGTVEPPAPARSAVPPPAPGAAASTVAIAPIVGGSAAVPGGLVHVSVTASSGVQRVLLIGAGDPIEIDGPPFETDVAIPADAAGPLTLTAIGDDGGGFAVSDPLVLTAVPAGAVASVAASPASLSLSSGGAPSPLEAIGAWDDGVSRRITALPGTEFVSSDATVAQVDASGRVTPVSPGFATVTVRNGGASSDVPVSVLGTRAPACARCPRVVPAR